MKSIKELHEVDKPREKLFRRGVKSLKDHELMAVLLGTGVQGKDVVKLSKELIKLLNREFDTLSLETLLKIHGLGKAKASQILSAIELSKRYLNQKNSIKINNSNDVYNELKSFSQKKQEYFFALYLDGANHLIDTKVITIGTLNQSLVHPREVFAYAVEKRCASIIVAHNHPSGILKPSSEDMSITQRLKESGALLGIELLDHLIFTSEGFMSLQEEGLL